MMLTAHADNTPKSANNLYDLMGKSTVSQGKVLEPIANPENQSANISANAVEPNIINNLNKNQPNNNDPLKDLYAFKNFDQNLNLPKLNLTAQAWVLYDVNAQQILNEFEMKKNVPIGEFNQLMLLYLTFEAMNEQKLKLLEKYKLTDIEENIKELPFDAPKMILNTKISIDLQNIIKGMIYTKGFDAAQALAYLLDPEYLKNPNALIDRMNEKAKQLGLKDTRFNYFAPLLTIAQNNQKENQGITTVNDLLILTKRLHFDFPQFNYLFEGNDFVYEQSTIHNQNSISVLENVSDENRVIHGFYKQNQNKTGFILQVKKIENSLTRQERFLIGIIIHTPDNALLEEDSLKMMNYGLAEFDTIKVYAANNVISQQKLWMGKQKTLKIGVLKDAYIALPKNMTARLNTILDKPKFLYAPIEKGQLVGYIRYLHQNKELVSIPIVSLENVEEAFFLTRLWHMVLAWFD